MKYLAYFQAYTNTYGELEQLKRMYEEALDVEVLIGKRRIRKDSSYVS